MRILKTYSLLIAFLGLATAATGQYSYKQHIKYADESFEKGNYREAMIHYNKAWQLAEYLAPDRLYRLGESAFNTFSLELAAANFSRYLETDSTYFADESAFRLAEIEHLQGAYDKAIISYNIFLSEYGDVNDSLAREAAFLREQAGWARDAGPDELIERVQPAEGNINSPYSDNAPYVLDDSVYYSSLRFPIEEDPLNRFRSKLFRNSDVINVAGQAGDQLVSNLAFAPDTSFVIFSICDYEEDGFDISCRLFYAPVDTSTWLPGTGVALPERINRTGSTVSHPSVRANGEGYTLYYSSDQPGGKGQRDIWKADFDSDLNFDIPVNLSYLNTERDEVTPFYHANSRTLFFGSNGHRGYGGYDIYKIAEDQRDSSFIVNMGDKINSSHNDIDPFVNEFMSEIYFSSNRPGAQYLEAEYETCCYDIFVAEVKECSIDLLADFFDSYDDTPLEGVDVQVIDKTNDIVIYNQTLTGPQLNISIDCDREYEIVAKKPGYQDLNYPLEGIRPIYGQVNEAYRKIYLDPSDYTLTVKLFDQEQPEMPLYNAVVTLLNEDTGEEKRLSNGDSHIYNFEILPKSSYRILAEKVAYDDKIVEFNSGVGDPDIEKIIYLKRTEIVKVTKVSLKNAIPVQLYFDNDEPDKRTTRETSSQNYTETFYKYYNRKDKFKDVYASKFSRGEREEARERIDTFFEEYIKGGFDKYEAFKEQLLIVLEAGQKVNIYLRGYASPVHDSDYNTALGKRRVDSIRKEFDEWRNGIFVPYLESGQLVVTERSFGEETAPEGISDDPSAPSQSIFSPEASIERRVEIDEINFDEN